MAHTLLIAGVTGLIGSTTLRLALADPRIARVHAPVRRELPGHPRSEQWVDPDLTRALRDVRVDAVICCLGTTIRKVGGDREKFVHVDKELVLATAEWALRNGARVFVVVSSMGADKDSRIFYNRVKGRMEEALRALELPALHIFRPSILTGPRLETRIGERIGILLMRLLTPLMVGPARPYRPMPHDVLARALMRTALEPGSGVQVHTYDAIRRLAGD